MKDLAERFLLSFRKEGSDMAQTYFHLFSMLNKKSLERDLEYLFELQSGCDDFYKEDGKENWFFIWHKSMRQSDLFQNLYYRKDREELTKEEHSEWRYLWDLYFKQNKEKESPKGSERLFTEEYRRYLHLSTKKREMNSEESVCGHLDMILWNIIHLDKDGLLVRQFENIFKEKQAHTLN